MLLRRSSLWLKVSLSVGVVVSGMILAAAPASAHSHPFAGAAPGSVTCNVTMKFKFDPPITSSSGPQDAGYPQVVGALNPCTPSDSAVTHLKSSFHGNLSGVPYNCVDNDGVVSVTQNNDVEVNFEIRWLGSVSGYTNARFNPTTLGFENEEPSADSSGDLGFVLPNPSVSGNSVIVNDGSSFDDLNAGTASASVYGNGTTATGSQLAALCTPNGHGVVKGIKGVTLAGSITIGAPGS